MAALNAHVRCMEPDWNRILGIGVNNQDEGFMFSGKRPENIGIRDGGLAPCPATPNCVSSQAESKRHYIAPLACEGDCHQAVARLKAVVERMPGIALIDEKPDYLYFECVSKRLGFVDDLEFLGRGRESQIEVRSASRLGYSDLGANRRRVEAIRREFGKARYSGLPE